MNRRKRLCLKDCSQWGNEPEVLVKIASHKKKVFMYRNGIRSYLFYACCAIYAAAITSIGTELQASAQTASTELSFAVATIKPVDPSHPFDPMHHGAHVTPAGASYWSVPIWLLIAYAYGVQQDQIIGPDWVNTNRFDIEAKFPEGAHKEDAPRMLQALLKDRFKLAFHIEKRELEGYVLVVGKHGEKLRPTAPDLSNPEPDAASKSGNKNVEEGNANQKIIKNQDGSSTIRGKTGSETVRFDQEGWTMHHEVSKVTMEELASRLSVCVGSGMHKVEDQTGIKGFYQVSYDCPLGVPRPQTGREAAGALPTDPEDGSSLTRSLDALGLKLEKRKISQDVYVIDHVERPSEN